MPRIATPLFAGSNPVPGSIFLSYLALAQMEERDATNVEAASSILAGESIFRYQFCRADESLRSLTIGYPLWTGVAPV
jgi:hypothetical protein